MAPPCPLANKLIENEIVEFKAGDKALLLDRKIEITIDEFKECDIGNNVVIRIKTEDEVVPIDLQNQKPTKRKPKKSIDDSNAPFNQSYPLPDYKLEINPPVYSQEIEAVDTETNHKESIIGVEGVVASIAMVLAIAQQIKQKKSEAESKKCCADNKIKFGEYDSKIQALDTKIDEKTKQESKALHAEIYEQYKELKELKDDSNELKEVLSRLIKTVADRK
jgi:hypothetical protein